MAMPLLSVGGGMPIDIVESRLSVIHVVRVEHVHVQNSSSIIAVAH